MEPVSLIEVHIWGQLVGAIARDPQRGAYVFQYAEPWRRRGVELAPRMMPTTNTNSAFIFPGIDPVAFHGLPGLIADALPDHFGNQLIDAIESLTQGVISVNPNTMYPLLRDLESRGMIEGSWEHPDKRTRRFYSITPAGEAAYQELLPEIEPFLDSVIRSVTMIKAEVYGSRAD